ncbi:MAG: tail fiber protein [Leptospiraceae bacterium]|nr:tail fiber protein [Leptospiraceae bacterium]
MNKEFKQSFQKGISQGLGIIVVILFSLGTVWAVAGLTGTYNTFSDGETLTAGKLNQNFESLRIAISSTVGTISAYGGSSAPTGWLLCDGTSVSQTTYADLYAVIGCNFGCSGANFSLPDLRGRFLRGRDGGAGRDPDSGSRTFMSTGGNTADNVGSVQVDELKSHNHGIMPSNGITSGSCWWDGTGGFADCTQPATLFVLSRGGNETRPVNAYVNWIVKY